VNSSGARADARRTPQQATFRIANRTNAPVAFFAVVGDVNATRPVLQDSDGTVKV
jgi:hypothetical protein